MSQAPSMPMYWDAYLADTTHLTTEEHGAYLLLLAAMWRRNGWVPDDDRDNARILGMTTARWRRTKERLSTFLIFDDGRITQKNLLKIWKNTQEKISKNRENGSLGGRPKSSVVNDLNKANGYVSQNPNETISEPEPYPEPESDKNTVTSYEVTRAPPSKSSSDYSDEFEAFWRQYPEKAGKKPAAKAFAKARKSASMETLIAALEHYKDVCRAKQRPYCHAATWLNQERWNDEEAATDSRPGRTIRGSTIVRRGDWGNGSGTIEHEDHHHVDSAAPDRDGGARALVSGRGNGCAW